MLLLLGAAITASFFDSLNPSAIAEQILLQTMVRNKRHILFFIAGIGFANLAMGLAIYYGAANWASQAYSAITAAYPLYVYGAETAVGLLDGFRSADQDTVNLLRSMGASKGQIFRMVKLPSSLGRFFSSLRVSVSYSIVGAVIAEWLGGNSGLGVYMTRVRKSYAFDKMFAVIVLISLISLLLMWLVSMIQRLCMPYEKYGGNQS